MKNGASEIEHRLVHYIMNGFLVCVAIVWFFILAYIYLSWVVLPTFFNDAL
jgi:hypothetical protein